jgi:lysophospholipase L1-like esterase
MKRPSWMLTGLMVGGAGIFGIGIGIGLDHYRLKIEHIRDRMSFFRQMEGGADVVMLGDSLTEGGGDWRELFPDFVVKNQGIGGDTTEAVLGRLDEVIGRKPKVVAVLVGINDVLRGVDPAKIIFRIEEILRRLKASGTTPIMQSILFATHIPATNATIASINAELAAWCTKEKITFLDLNVVLSPSGILDPAISTDGIHLNYSGYLKWSAALYPVLRQTLNPGSNKPDL